METSRFRGMSAVWDDLMWHKVITDNAYADRGISSMSPAPEGVMSIPADSSVSSARRLMGGVGPMAAPVPVALPPGPHAAISIRGLVKTFQDKVTVNSLSLDIPRDPSTGWSVPTGRGKPPC